VTHPAASLSGSRLRQTLVTVLDHVLPAHAELDYRLVGTGAALLHGVVLPAADVDLLVKTRPDVDAFAEALASFPCLDTPAWLPAARQYYANYDVNGVEVGISTVEVESELDTVETFGRGPWEHFVLLPCGPYVVPAVTLELRLITELLRGREDRYRPLLGHMRGKSYDLSFVLRGMTTTGLPQALQDEVRCSLGGS